MLAMSFSSKIPVILELGLLFVQQVHASFHCRSMVKEQTLMTFDPSDGEFDSPLSHRLTSTPWALQ